MVFGLGKKRHLTGLDIGSRNIKAAQIEEAKTGSVLKNFGMVDIPPGAIEDGVIKDPQIVSDAIRQLFKENDFNDQNVTLSIGGYSVIVKKIDVKTMSEEELQGTINFEAEQYIPFDIADVNLDFQILGENELNPAMMGVLLVAAKKDMIDEYVNLVDSAGLHAVIMDIDAFALQNIFEMNYDVEDENVALIDIGASKTSLNILKNMTSVFMRDVSLGCNQINQKIVSLIDCSLEEAEQIKRSEQSDQISTSDLREIVSSVTADWATEIKRALDFFYSTYPEDEIGRIVLSGGGANIQEFRQLLEVEASAEVETINPFEKFEIDSNLDSSYLELIAPQAAICMGLAIRKVADK
ncbi:type IV pilus assembly protein PilM [Thermodesulfobacteriota bacterium]